MHRFLKARKKFPSVPSVNTQNPIKLTSFLHKKVEYEKFYTLSRTPIFFRHSDEVQTKNTGKGVGVESRVHLVFRSTKTSTVSF